MSAFAPLYSGPDGGPSHVSPYNTRSSRRNGARGEGEEGGSGSQGAAAEAEVEARKREERAARERSFERLRSILQAHVGGPSHGAPSSPGRARLDTARLLRSREAMGHWSPSKRTRVSSRVLPQGDPEVVDLGNSRAYIGHFAKDGNVFVAGFQNQTIRLYDVTQTHQPWQLRKEIIARSLNWTITDTALSPNQQLLIYATISPTLHAVNINATENVRSEQNITDLHTPLDFGAGFSDGSFGLWAINFSKDGRVILAGSSDFATYLYVAPTLTALGTLPFVPSHVDHTRLPFRSCGCEETRKDAREVAKWRKMDAQVKNG